MASGSTSIRNTQYAICNRQRRMGQNGNGNGKHDDAIPPTRLGLYLPAAVPGTPRTAYQQDQPEIRHMLRTVADTLRDAGSPTPRLDAEVLLAHVLGLSRAQLYARLRDAWPAAALEPYGALLRR